MSGASLRPTRVEGHDALVLENDAVRATVLPGLGGRVWTLEDLARRRQWIWHRPGVPLVACAPGASYDDVWAGGWEELFPNDAAGIFEGRDLPDHGEWWTMAWDADGKVDPSGDVVVRLTATSRVIRAACTKTITLRRDASELAIAYEIESREDAPFHFLFKQHLPVALTPDCRLVLPGGQVEAVDTTFGTILPGAGPYAWPVSAGDLRIVPPASSGAREFVYVSDLPDGWCGIDDQGTGASLRLHADRAVFPHTWLFLSYGGWRDVYTAVLEPCTNKPKALAAAVRAGASARLAPGERLTTTVVARLDAAEGRRA